MSSELHDTPRQNRILAALPADEYSRLEDDLEWVALSAGQIVHQSGGNQPYVYFPTSSILSRIATGPMGLLPSWR